MYQIGYFIGYLIGFFGVIVATVTIISFFLLPIVALFFPDKLLLHWRKRIGKVWPYGIDDPAEQNLEHNDRKDEESRAEETTGPDPEEGVEGKSKVLIQVAGVPIEIELPRSAEPGPRPSAC